MRKIYMVLFAVLVCPMVASAQIPETNQRPPEQKKIKGFTGTPVLPDSKWHVHDPNRPQPDVVEPAYEGTPVEAPEDATVLFDGTDLEHWTNDSWIVKDGYMEVKGGNQLTKQGFGDIHLHIEWMIPESIGGWGQSRGNSGVFLMKQYEIQVLDCWGNRTYPDGMAGAIYGQSPPRVNACRKPGQWQSFDIFFKAPEFEDGKVKKKAVMTVYHNNVLIQDQHELLGKTTYKGLPEYNTHSRNEPIKLQDHRNPVRYRNIWVTPLDSFPEGETLR